MSEKRGPGCLQIAVGITALAMLASLLVPTLGRTARRGNIIIGINNARQVITELRLYSSDHDGKYPDALLHEPNSSNEVFQVLFKKGIIENEMVFGCPVSPFEPDGRIGSKPDFARALEPGENHWAMTPGLSDSARGSIPLVYESPAVATWPPKWNPDAKGKLVKGRAWSNGIIIGMNDSSVAIQPLEAKEGSEVMLKKVQDEKDLFELANSSATSAGWRVLDVEVKSK